MQHLQGRYSILKLFLQVTVVAVNGDTIFVCVKPSLVFWMKLPDSKDGFFGVIKRKPENILRI